MTEATGDAWGDDDADIDPDDDDRLTSAELLDDLFDDYDTYESYDGDPVEIVAKLCAQLGLKPEAEPLAEPAPVDADRPAVEQARALELARNYLERARWTPEPAHGPPDG